MKTSAYLTNAQSRFAIVILDNVLRPPCLTQHNRRCPCFSLVPEAMQEATLSAPEGAVSAEKALQESETKTRELLVGTEEESVFRRTGH